MAKEFDVIVCGLGATGSAALFHLAKTGYQVCGIDRFDPPHDKGSSHGESRIIRQAYHENPVYVPFVQRAWALWEQLQSLTSDRILAVTGGLTLGNPDAGVITGAIDSAHKHGLPVTLFSNMELKQQFPAFIPEKQTIAVLERNAGILFPENCIKAQLTEALKAGGTVCRNETVTGIDRAPTGITVHTDREICHTQKLVMAAGPWMPTLLPELQLPLTVERQVLYWFRDGSGKKINWENLPVYIWEYAKEKLFYGFPDLGGGIKVARHHQGLRADPDGYDTAVHGNEIEAMTEILENHLDMTPVFVRAETCLYTNTPDEHFIIDRHPQDARILIASPCSGHGFKFSSYIGQILARLATDADPGIELDFFSLQRFQQQQGSYVK